MPYQLNQPVKVLLTSLFVCIVAIGCLQAQDETSVLKIEKNYIHTDRTCYTIGESLWYKAYSVLAYNNLLLDQSRILYVELISPDSKIIARNKTYLGQGLGHGDFKLTDSLGVKKPGVYQLRAYTNWNRNFGGDFVFKKHIEIIDVFNDRKTEDREVGKPRPIKQRKNIENAGGESKPFQVQFFPEGGNLVDGVTSVVAFKAVDNKGNPIKITGRIVDAEGQLVTLLASLHDGMGKFQFKSVSGATYKAEITAENGKTITIPLPDVSKTGYLIGAAKVKGKDMITIKTNRETLEAHNNGSVSIICKVRGVSYFESTFPIETTGVSFVLPKDKIPEGICQLTLYDVNSRPQSERLIYIDKEADLEVHLALDKKVYKPEAPVALSISSKSKAGVAVSASYSLSCTDVNSVSDHDNGTTICSYFLMESDVRGKIHNPDFYFDRSNSKRLFCLDLLLLTQGWRDFVWKTFPKVDKIPKYKVEKGFQISGMVKQLLGSKPKPDSQVTLALLNDKEGMNLFSDITNSSGRFKFKDMVFTGKTTVLVNTTNKKGKGRGELLLDSLEKAPMSTQFKYVPAPEDLIREEAIKQHVYNKYIAYGVSPENILDEVEVVAIKEDEYPSLYGAADYTVLVDETTQQFTDIYQLIQYSIPGVYIRNDTLMFTRFNAPAHIIIDGIPAIDNFQVSNLQVDNVAKIEAIKGAGTAIFGSEGANGVIIIYTKIGSVPNNEKKVYHSVSQEVNGFHDARMFYVPNVDDLGFDRNNSDAIRNTLYWNPYVHPDQTGGAKITYKNSKVETKVKVTLEGITATGIPVVEKTYYTIEK